MKNATDKNKTLCNKSSKYTVVALCFTRHKTKKNTRTHLDGHPLVYLKPAHHRRHNPEGQGEPAQHSGQHLARFFARTKICAKNWTSVHSHNMQRGLMQQKNRATKLRTPAASLGHREPPHFTHVNGSQGASFTSTRISQETTILDDVQNHTTKWVPLTTDLRCSINT